MAKMSRIDLIGQNGNTGDHYKYVRPPCYSSYPSSRKQRAINGCEECPFMDSCVDNKHKAWEVSQV